MMLLHHRYCPILPMLLINGSEGIGTGWSTKVPNHDIREIADNIKRMMDGDEPLPMVKKYFSSVRKKCT